MHVVYFAYGSNLLFARLHARCPSVNNIGVGYLADHRMNFNKPGGDASGKCGIEHQDGAQVIGVLYQMDAAEKPVLDTIEGVGHGYIDKEIVVQTDRGEVECFTYYPTRLGEQLPPWDWYKAFVVEGARENNFPQDYLSTIEAVFAERDPNSARRAENFGILGSAF